MYFAYGSKAYCQVGYGASNSLGTIHVLPTQDLGFSDPLPFVITFSIECNQKMPFSAVDKLPKLKIAKTKNC